MSRDTSVANSGDVFMARWSATGLVDRSGSMDIRERPVAVIKDAGTQSGERAAPVPRIIPRSDTRVGGLAEIFLSENKHEKF